MVNALLAVFLILVAVSAAVTGSMIVLAVFDRAFGKKNTQDIVVEMIEGEQLENPSKPKVEVAESKPKPKPLATYAREHSAKRSTGSEAGFGSRSQRVRHLR
jgi:hypothetical protein